MKNYDIITAEIKVKITNEDIDNIMTTAFNGGINYWCYNAEIVEDKYLGYLTEEKISLGGKVRLYVEEPFDDYETEEYILDKNKLLKGIKMAMEKYGLDINLDDHMHISIDDVDADAADVIIQYALFGEIVYC